MMIKTVLLTILVLYFEKGQSHEFEQECNILQTLEVLQKRLDGAETRLQEQETELTNTVARLNEQSIELDKTRDLLVDAVARLQSQGEVLSRSSQKKTMFTARLSRHITNLGYHQTIVFDDVITNINDCYSPTTGVFTARTNGTFVFLISIMAPSGEQMQTEMVTNNRERLALTYAYVPDAYDQGANGAVLVLSEGDTVWVRHHDLYGDKLFGGGWCTFSGFQIQ